MAYHDTVHIPAAETAKSILAPLGRLFSNVGHALVAAAEGNRRMKTVERLQAKSDDELAALGIRREDIVRHAFRDVFFT